MMWFLGVCFQHVTIFVSWNYWTCGDSLLVNDSLEVSFCCHEFVLILLELVWVLSSVRFFSRVQWHNHAVWMWLAFWLCLLQVSNSSDLILSAITELCLLKTLPLSWKVLFKNNVENQRLKLFLSSSVSPVAAWYVASALAARIPSGWGIS